MFNYPKQWEFFKIHGVSLWKMNTAPEININ